MLIVRLQNYENPKDKIKIERVERGMAVGYKQEWASFEKNSILGLILWLPVINIPGKLSEQHWG